MWTIGCLQIRKCSNHSQTGSTPFLCFISSMKVSRAQATDFVMFCTSMLIYCVLQIREGFGVDGSDLVSHSNFRDPN